MLATRFTISIPFLALGTVALGQNDIRLQLEGGYAYQTRNTCAIPADSNKFSYRDLIGRGPFRYGRIEAIFHDQESSGYRLAIVPFTVSGVGRLPSAVSFNGVNFAPGVDTFGRYTFNNYRFTWWHKWRPIDGISIRAGWTLFIRDADVFLSQSGKSASFYNLGPVPLFYLLAEKDFGDRLTASFSFDGLVAPQGGALDFGLKFGYRLNSNTSLTANVRYLDGGTGSGSAYNYATINYLALGIEFKL